MPGKFELCDSEAIGERLYQFSLDGCSDADAGSCDETGRWYGLFRNLFPSDLVPDDAPESEQDWAATIAGAILSEDSYGFVTYQLYTSDADLMYNWAAIETEVETAYAAED